jgi:CheY-like chemotaxis protein
VDNLDPISQVSHQLRTPMTVIMSTVDNLLAGAFGPLNEEQTRWLKKLTNHTANLEKLLYETLTLMKVQMEKNGFQALPAGEKKIGFIPREAAESIERFKPAAFSQERAPLVLAVDDEPDILDVIQEGLKMKGFDTITASNGTDAVRLAIDAKPDLILLDVLLKDRHGMDVCREIKAKVRVFTPVIMMTGQSDLREKVSGVTTVADDLLSKPFQIEELFSRVSSMLKIKKLTDQLDVYRMKESA